MRICRGKPFYSARNASNEGHQKYLTTVIVLSMEFDVCHADHFNEITNRLEQQLVGMSVNGCCSIFEWDTFYQAGVDMESESGVDILRSESESELLKINRLRSPGLSIGGGLLYLCIVFQLHYFLCLKQRWYIRYDHILQPNQAHLKAGQLQVLFDAFLALLSH